MAIPSSDPGHKDEPKPEPLVVTLEARVGNRHAETGECIGTYQRSIVFLPRGCDSGKTYRVVLIAIQDQTGLPKKDRGGNVMYRARPAPPEYFERWRDNGDGTVSRVTFSNNWMLEEGKEGVSETRALVQRDGVPRHYSTTEIVWGTCLVDALVRVSTRTEIPEIREVISDGKLVERETSTRDGGTTQVDHPVTTVEPDAYQSGWTKSWRRDRLSLSQDDEAGVHLAVTYGDTSHRHSALWKELPVWAQAHLMAPYPVCACGRERVDTPSGATTCSVCQHEETAVALIDRCLPVDKRKEIAHVAALCHQAADAGHAFEGQAGFDLLSTLMSDEPRANPDWEGYPWYYLTTEGFYASRFPPVAMMILSTFGSAQGQGLVRLAAWFPRQPSEHKAAEAMTRGDFYEKTQVRGEILEPELHESYLRDACAAVKLCGTLSDRIAAIGAVASCKTHGGESYELDQMICRHDYAGAMAKVAELADGLAGRKRLTDLLASEYAACPACKGEWYETRRNGKHCECMRDVYPPDAEDITLKHSVAPGGQVLVEVVWGRDGRITLVARFLRT